MIRSQRQTLHHGLLLIGPQGSGKMDLSLHLSQGLLCQDDHQKPCHNCKGCQLFKAGSHGDFHVIESEKQIGIDLIRTAMKTLQEKAYLSGNKVLLIKQAETMTESSANALLKTLEEPTANTYLILLTSQLHLLLPTILSRVEKLTLPSPTTSQLKSWIVQQGLDEPDNSLLDIYRSTPLALKAMLDDPTHQSFTYATFKGQLGQLIKGQLSPVDMAQHWSECPDQALNWLQRYLIQANKKMMLRHEVYWLIYTITQTAKKSLLHNGVNKSLVLSHVLQELLLAVDNK
jgi:DNA polymerase-3 subunit delta'